MWLFEEECATPFLVEPEAYEGVKRIADKVADDVETVCGKRPKVYSDAAVQEKHLVLMATVGRSPLLDALVRQGVIDVSNVQGKREVYGIRLLGKENADERESWQEIPELAQTEELLVIYGSDKRGTIYGMFHLSEVIGVSPLYFWGDATPIKRKSIRLDASVEMISKEPSVKYRGFFINDEWPCFGNWTFHHYGGFTAEMYDKVFELLLRLKGNYLWPAMWTSSFALDGPGEKNAELADIYGVIMGNSHHEPALRAGEEWDFYRGENSIYGNEWNYVTNKEGLLRYWEDGLKRSGKYESIITVGMRGERDSVMEGPQSLEENIEILKDIIANQKKLIEKQVHRDGENPPLLLAIYKEVEQYFYGGDGVAGLREWEGIEDVIWMFCEDNFGHMRYLPEKEWKAHKGGYGMYFHLDYHGAPISYEWMNSTPLSAIWEQMTLAYESGIRDVWMVNVGDLKGNEYPLSYFMELAYDFDRWGSDAVNTTRKYTEQWMRTQFGTELPDDQCSRLVNVLVEATALIGRHRPEALNSETYHPFHECEADRVLMQGKRLQEELETLKNQLPETYRSGYYSMIYDPLQMALNLLEMQINAGKNAHYAKQGKKAANEYANMVDACIREDKRLIKRATERGGGKWYGMYGGAHVGFVKWNEDGCKYPLRTYVQPFDKPRLLVSRADDEAVLVKNYGNCEAFEIYDFMDEGVENLEIELANGGIGSLNCEIFMDACDWLSFELSGHEIVCQEMLRLICKRSHLPEKEAVCIIRIVAGDTEVRLHVHGRKNDTAGVPAGTFFPRNGKVVMLAEHYAKADIYEGGEQPGMITLSDFGLCGSGIKCKPFHYQLEKTEYQKLLSKDNARVLLPCASYPVWIKTAGTYTIEVWTAPSNPVNSKRNLQFAVRNFTLDDSWSIVDVLPKDYEAGEPSCKDWCDGVISQIHKTTCSVQFQQGTNEIQIGLLDGVLLLEKIMVYPAGECIPKSAMGPMESMRKV